jgi:L-iditol 2-dehydrogenase
MYYNNRDVRLEEMPKPAIGAGEILVKVKASGICGSDVMEWYRLKKAPLVLGHEATGEIAEVGRGVQQYKVGDRVFVSHHVPCNTCRFCLSGNHTVCETLHTTNYHPGGFAEYIRIPPLNVEGTFIEPLACVIRGQRMINLRPDQTTLILGAGISGLLHLLVARAKGAKRIIITDINEFRLQIAKELGASSVLNDKEDMVEHLADQVIVCTSSLSAFGQALKCVDRAGTILCFAPTEPGVNLPVPVNDFWRQSIKIMHSYGGSPQDIKEAIELLGKKTIPVEKLITHRLSLKEAGRGFNLVASARECIKVILLP